MQSQWSFLCSLVVGSDLWAWCVACLYGTGDMDEKKTVKRTKTKEGDKKKRKRG